MERCILAFLESYLPLLTPDRCPGRRTAVAFRRKQIIHVRKALLHSRESQRLPAPQDLSISVGHFDDQIAAVLLHDFAPCNEFCKILLLGRGGVQAHKRALSERIVHSCSLAKSKRTSVMKVRRPCR